MAFYPDPSVHKQTFKNVNSDLADQVMPHDAARFILNCNILSTDGGKEFVVTNVKGNKLLAVTQPAGTCICHGAKADEKYNKIYWAVWNSNGNHCWFIYDTVLNTFTTLFQNLVDSATDILFWDPAYPIFHIDIIDGNIIHFCDGLNKARKFNIAKMLDKSDTGYGFEVVEDYITAYKKCPVYAPVPSYFTDLTRAGNYQHRQPAGA
jgi:hypothetical protein